MSSSTNDLRTLYLQDFDASKFTPAELKVIHSAVLQYINDQRIVEIKESILDKIEREIMWRSDLQLSCSRLAQWESPDGSGDISLVTTDVNTPPLFKFASCPESIRVQDIIRHNPAYLNTFKWLPNNHKKGRGSVELSYNTSTFLPQLTDLNIELLFAFYMYHSLRERSVVMSGLPFTAPTTEGESEGEETSSGVHADACRP